MRTRTTRHLLIVLPLLALALAGLACSRPRRGNDVQPTAASVEEPVQAVTDIPPTAAPAEESAPVEPTSAPPTESVPDSPTATVEADATIDPTADAAVDELEALVEELMSLNKEADDLGDIDSQINR